jgi:hypothetical protein
MVATLAPVAFPVFPEVPLEVAPLHAAMTSSSDSLSADGSLNGRNGTARKGA